MRSGFIEFLLYHPNIVLVDATLGILQLIFPSSGCVIALMGDVHHEAEVASGVLDPRFFVDLKSGRVLLAVVLANASMH